MTVAGVVATTLFGLVVLYVVLQVYVSIRTAMIYQQRAARRVGARAGKMPPPPA